MNSYADINVKSFLQEIIDPDGVIVVVNLKKFGGAGAHDIYRSDKYPGFLLKVMRSTIGNDSELPAELQKLDEQYSALYKIFGHSRCIVENRSIQLIKTSHSQSPQNAIVSVVPFDSCFESKEKFGFNVCTAELDVRLIEENRDLYRMMNRLLLSGLKPSSSVLYTGILLKKVGKYHLERRLKPT